MDIMRTLFISLMLSIAVPIVPEVARGASSHCYTSWSSCRLPRYPACSLSDRNRGGQFVTSESCTPRPATHNPQPAPHNRQPTCQGWVTADDLVSGDVLASPDGQRETVAGSVEVADPNGIQVYNFTVAVDHTYFVEGFGGSTAPLDAVWVHNGCDWHDGLPKFLGGFPRQILYNVNDALHSAFHSDLTKALMQEGFPRVGGIGGAVKDWEDFFLKNAGSQPQAPWRRMRVFG